MSRAVDQLRAHAAEGVPTLATLQRQLSTAAGAVLSAAAVGSDKSWAEGLRARLTSVITVRRTGDIPGDHPEARVARAEVRLRDGDLAAAIEEMSLLEGDAGSTWLAAARSRLAAVEGLRRLDAGVADGLAVGAGGGN